MRCKWSDARLRGRANFALFSRAKHYRGRLLRAAVIAGEGRKCAFVVSKKVSVQAVGRNRLKRRLRELYRKWCTLLPQNSWFIFMALAGADHADFASLEADFKKLCESIASQNVRGFLR